MRYIARGPPEKQSGTRLELIASFATFLMGFFIPHGNMFYIAFWYFPSFLLVFVTISVHWRAVAVPVLVLVLFVPQYAVGYFEWHKYARQDDLQVARSAIAIRGTSSRAAAARAVTACAATAGHS